MAVVAWEGFDFCNVVADIATLPGWTCVSSSTIAVVTGRIGGKSLYMLSGSTVNATKLLPGGSTATACAGGAIKTDVINMVPQIQFLDVATVQCKVSINEDTGLVTAFNAAGTSVGTYTIPAWTPLIWNYLEAAATIHPTAGTIQVWVDGVSVINLSGLNTRSSANSTCDRVVFNWPASTAVHAYLDDVYLKNDLTPLGPVRVLSESMVSASGTPGFTPLTSTNVSQINETATDGDTSYNSSSTAGASDVFNTGTVAATVTTVYGVGTVLNHRKDDVGPRTTSSLISSSGTITNGNTISPATNYVWYEDFFLTDPATGAAWTTAGLNAVKPGYRVIA